MSNNQHYLTREQRRPECNCQPSVPRAVAAHTTRCASDDLPSWEELQDHADYMDDRVIQLLAQRNHELAKKRDVSAKLDRACQIIAARDREIALLRTVYEAAMTDARAMGYQAWMDHLCAATDAVREALTADQETTR